MSAKFFKSISAAIGLAVCGNIAGLCALGISAQAAPQPQRVKGAYVTAGVGGSWGVSPSTSQTSTGAVDSFTTSTSINATQSLGGGVAVEAGFGYDFGNKVRAELTYVNNNYALSTLNFSGSTRVNQTGQVVPFSGSSSLSGNLSTNSVMISGYYDIPTNSRWVPYIGAGLGWTSVSIPSSQASTSVTAGSITTSSAGTTSADSASAFGYQAKIGVSYLIGARTDAYVEGTYQGNTSFTLNASNYDSLNGFGARAGFRYRFSK